MATPQEKLAESLDALKALQDRDIVAIQGADLSRAHRERLLKNGFFREVIKGWYITARPDDAAGESTAWYASFWDFCAAYLRERFGSRWCSVTKAFSVTAYRESSGTVSAGGALSQGGEQAHDACPWNVVIGSSLRPA